MVEYSLVNLLTVVLGVAFLANGYRLVRSGREDLTVFLVSGVIGIGLVVVAIVPSSLFGVAAGFLGIEFRAVAVLILSNLTLFVVVTYLFDRMGQLKTNVSRLNEELSLLRQRVETTEQDGSASEIDD